MAVKGVKKDEDSAKKVTAPKAGPVAEQPANEDKAAKPKTTKAKAAAKPKTETKAEVKTEAKAEVKDEAKAKAPAKAKNETTKKADEKPKTEKKATAKKPAAKKTETAKKPAAKKAPAEKPAAKKKAAEPAVPAVPAEPAMKVLFAASEAQPFIASGGLADVAGALPKALAESGVDCRVVMPLYGDMKPEMREKLEYITCFDVTLGWRRQYCGVFKATVGKVTYYFIDNEYYFKRTGIYGF